jgi:hypothetical protein
VNRAGAPAAPRSGNIDSYVNLDRNTQFKADYLSVDLPALNYTLNINITSTGNLDCVALAAKVVNATNPFYTLPYTEGGAGNNSFVCSSRKGNITTYKVVPKSGAEMVKVPWGLIALVGMTGWLGCCL